MTGRGKVRRDGRGERSLPRLLTIITILTCNGWRGAQLPCPGREKSMWVLWTMSALPLSIQTIIHTSLTTHPHTLTHTHTHTQAALVTCRLTEGTLCLPYRLYNMNLTQFKTESEWRKNTNLHQGTLYAPFSLSAHTGVNWNKSVLSKWLLRFSFYQPLK